MNNNRIKWVNAAKKLVENPTEKILCPDCNKSFLNVNDVFLDDNQPEKGVERYLLCEICNKYEAILLKRLDINYGITQNNNIWYNYLKNTLEK